MRRLLRRVLDRFRLRRVALTRLHAMAAKDAAPRPVRFITPHEAHHAVLERVMATGQAYAATRENSGLYRVEEVGE